MAVREEEVEEDEGRKKTVSTLKHPVRPGKKGKGHGETNTEGDAANECGWLIDAGKGAVCVWQGGGWFLVRH